MRCACTLQARGSRPAPPADPCRLPCNPHAQLSESQDLYQRSRQGPALLQQGEPYASEGSEAYAPHSRGARRWAVDEAGPTPADSFTATNMEALAGAQPAGQPAAAAAAAAAAQSPRVRAQAQAQQQQQQQQQQLLLDSRAAKADW